MIDKIVKILIEHEENLSDSYDYYSADPTLELKNIAKEILAALKEE